MHRHSARRALALLLAVAALTFIGSRPAQADEVSLSTQFSFSDSEVRVSGWATTGGRPAADQTLLLLLDGAHVQSTRTGGDGGFQASVPLTTDLAPGNHTIEVRPEAGGAGSSQAFVVAGPVGDTAQQSVAPAAPAASTLSASGPATAVNGENITIAGTLVGPDGAGIAGAGLALSDPSGDVQDSYTVTAADGSFETMYTVPEDHADGELALTLSFAGAGSAPAATGQVTLSVTHLAVSSDSPTPEPSPSATTSQPSPAGQPSSTVPSATATEASAAHGGPSGPLVWLIAVVLGVGAIAVAATVALVVRSRSGSRRARVEGGESGPLGFLDEDEPPSAAPRRGR